MFVRYNFEATATATECISELMDVEQQLLFPETTEMGKPEKTFEGVSQYDPCTDRGRRRANVPSSSGF